LDNLLYAFLIVSLVVLGRYLLTVSFFYLLFWKLCIFDNIFKRLHSTKLQSTQWVHQIKWSIFSSLIFAISAIVMATLWSKGHTQIYLKLDEYPVWYHFLSFLILTLIHEIYFYATHIWMHRPQVFRKIHSIHHY